MKANLLIILLFCFVSSKANIYYFSTISGDDSRTAAQAQNPQTPWKTINKLNSIFNTLSPGDAVLFKRGETFFGSIEISKSREYFGFASSTVPITIGAFGSGNKPVITGLQTITNWVSVGGGIYEATLSVDTLNLVTFQGNVQPIGRWPKVSETGNGYLPFQSHVGTSSITSNAISVARNFVGGEVVIRKMGWMLDRGRVTAQTSTKVTYIPFVSPGHPTVTYEPLDGFAFFFQNHINTLTELGNWMFEASTKKLRMYFGTNSPSKYTIQVPTIQNLISITSSSYITLDNLLVQGCNANAVSLNYDYYLQILNSNINLTGVDAITTGHFTKSSNITLKNCTISNSINNAITANGTTDWIIQNNVIRNTGLIRGMGMSGDGQYNSISFPGSKSLIEYNVIKNTGYIGIDFRGDSTIIKNNYIDSFCLVKSDGGGIYTSAENGKKGRKVIGNIVLNGFGDRTGRPQGEMNDYRSGNVHGIYMDAGATDVQILDNTVAHCSSSGLELSSPVNTQVLNNTLYNNTFRQIYYWESKGPISNLTLKKNILFAADRNQLISYIDGSSNTTPKWGVLDSNFYCRPFYEPGGIDTLGYSHSPTFLDYTDGGIIQAAPSYRFISLDKWQQHSGQDMHTKKTPITDISKILFEYNASTSPKTIVLDTTYIDVRGNSYSGSVTIAPYSSIILLKQNTSQTIKFNTISDKPYCADAVNLTATASSCLPITYKLISGPAALLVDKLLINGSGVVVVEASQPGNATYFPAPTVTRSFTVRPKLSFVNNGTIVKDANCGSNDGALYIVPTSGTAPYMYSKDGGATYVAGPADLYGFPNLSAGTYQLRLKDVAGCESEIIEREVRSNCRTRCTAPTFSNSVSIVDASCSNNDGSLNIVPTSGTAPFMYSKDGGRTYVSGGSNGYAFKNLSAGTYRLRITDATGCESVVVGRTVKFVCAAPCTPPTFINNGTIVAHASCGNSDGALYIVPSTGTAPFMYSKDGGVTYVTGPSDLYGFGGLAAGTYKLRLKDAAGCESEIVEKTVLNYYNCPTSPTIAKASRIPLELIGVRLDTESIITYPNPTRGKFRIVLHNFASLKAEVSISDAKGALLQKTQINFLEGNGAEFDLSPNGKGIYYIRITTKTGTKVSKVVIQ